MKLNKYQKNAIVAAIMEDVPKVDVVAEKVAIQAAIVKAMSPEVRKVYKTAPQALVKTAVPELYDDITWVSRDVIVGDVTSTMLCDILKPFMDKVEARRAVRSKLMGVVESCSTLAQLKKLLPEFESYFPSETAPTKNLPAVANLVTDMMKLGWPKSDAAAA